MNLPKNSRILFPHQYAWKYFASSIFIPIHKLSLYYRTLNFVYVPVRTLSAAVQYSVLPGMLYLPGIGRAFTAAITPNTCDYCCCFAATAADAGDGALCWWCSIFTVAADAPGGLAAALCCWSSTKISISCLCNFMSDEIVIQKGSILQRSGNALLGMKSQSEKIYRVRIKLSWKVKVIINNVDVRELLSVKFPQNCNCLEIGIWDQISSDNSWAPRMNKLSD